MTLDLHSRFNGPREMVELECPREDCDGRMLVDTDLASRLGIECPVPECDAEVRTA